jgi:hypothetical protein
MVPGNRSGLNFGYRWTTVMTRIRRILRLFGLAAAFLIVCRAQPGLKSRLDPKLARTTYSFPVRTGGEPLVFRVELDRTSTVTEASVFHEGQPNPFQILPACNKDIRMELREGDEQLDLVTHADLNFDGYEDVKLLQYADGNPAKSLYCVYLWDANAGRFRYEPQLFISNPMPDPKNRTITSHNDFQGGLFVESTYRWNGAKLEETLEKGLTYGSDKPACAFTVYCQRLINGKLRAVFEKATACNDGPIDDIQCPMGPPLPERRKLPSHEVKR